MFEYNLCGKWLELLKEIAPSLKRAGVLRDPALVIGIGQFAVIQSVAPSIGVEVSPIDLRELLRSNLDRKLRPIVERGRRFDSDGKRALGRAQRSDYRGGYAL